MRDRRTKQRVQTTVQGSRKKQGHGGQHAKLHASKYFQSRSWKPSKPNGIGFHKRLIFLNLRSAHAQAGRLLPTTEAAPTAIRICREPSPVVHPRAPIASTVTLECRLTPAHSGFSTTPSRLVRTGAARQRLPNCPRPRWRRHES